MSKQLLSILLIVSTLLVVQCKSDTTTADPNAANTLPSKEVNPEKSRETYNSNKSATNATKYITDVIKVAMEESTSTDKKRTLINDALAVADESKNGSLKGSLLNTFVRTLGPSDDPSKVLDLAAMLRRTSKSSAADILLYGYNQLEVTAEDKAKASELMGNDISDIDAEIDRLRTAISTNPDKYSINEANARTYVDACEAYAMVMPDAENAPVNLFNAAEVAKSLKSFNKSFALFDWLMNKYPDHPKAPTGLFLKGFILENELNNNKGAKVFYEEFLDKYPNHDLADDVEFLISNLGKTNEEILEMIESKKRSKVLINQ